MTRTATPKTKSLAGRILGWAFFSLLILVLIFTAVVLGVYRYLEPQLPGMEMLGDVHYQKPMSIFSKDGLLIAQYGEKKRTPISISEVPKKVVNAFLAAEDNRFFDHPGVDYQGLLRATIAYLRTGEKRQGGSTITMQVARNFFLTTEKTFFRKVKEILLSFKIESHLSKERILELYLNKIYFGQHAYGIVAAAEVYYNKPINELTTGEIAMIAGLPKAPSAFNPVSNPRRATERRDYVLKRMLKLKFIDTNEYENALKETVSVTLQPVKIDLAIPFAAEMVRNEIYQQFGEDAYTTGYRVYTTFDSHLQLTAEKSLRLGLHDYDDRHGYRGPQVHIDLNKIKTTDEWDTLLGAMGELGLTVPALVTAVGESRADLYMVGQGREQLHWRGMHWARRYINENRIGRFPNSPREILKVGDVIRVRKLDDGDWRLTQVPDVEGALVAMEPKTGAVLGVAGGYDYNVSKFNRATQSQRQPGSGFKPVLYASAFSHGYTPASVVNDAPISLNEGGGTWRPHNDGGRFYGPTRLRVALARSRNLVSVRLLKEIGIKTAVETALEFGFQPQELPNSLSLALGSGSATPLRMAQAYCVFANGGFRVDPYLIEKIEGDSGQIIFQATPQTACPECLDSGHQPGNLAARAISPSVHYMMNSVLQEVILRGTASDAKKLGRSDIAGKTGTTNDYRDAWFNGYNPALVAVAWIGFDNFKSLGHGETGGHTALPIWMRFMRTALKDVPEINFPVPSGVATTRIDPATGSPTSARNGKGLFEVFPSGDSNRSATAKRRTLRPRLSGDRASGNSSGGSGGNRPAPRSSPPKSIESLF